MEFKVMGKVHGLEDVQRMFSSCPLRLKRELLAWLLDEGKRFIGKKGRDGLIRQQLSNRKRWSDSGSWRTQVLGLLKSRVVDPITGKVINQKEFSPKSSGTWSGSGILGTGLSMNLQMGLLYRNKKKIHEALEFLETGGSIHSDKYMPIPVQGSNLSKAYEKFKHWYESGEFNVVYKNGLALYFLKSRGRNRSALMFVGRKNVNVKMRINLIPQFEAQKMAMEARASERIEKAIAKLKAA